MYLLTNGVLVINRLTENGFDELNDLGKKISDGRDIELRLLGIPDRQEAIGRQEQ